MLSNQLCDQLTKLNQQAELLNTRLQIAKYLQTICFLKQSCLMTPEIHAQIYLFCQYRQNTSLHSFSKLKICQQHNAIFLT